MPDKTLTCKDCGDEWTYTQEEQDYIKRMGFSDPKRCKPCRKAKKERNARRGNR